MALSDCEHCWMTPCECGHDYKNWSSLRKNELTKAINGASIDDVFEWLDSKGYLTELRSVIQKEFENRKL
jgi:hypothetical protein